jgi:hypothetical protein
VECYGFSFQSIEPSSMNMDYNSRQRKIYNDYNARSSDILLEILKNKKKYFPEVIEVVNDILSERNLRFPSSEQIAADDQVKKDHEITGSEQEMLLSEEKRNRDEAVKSFVNKLKEKSADELAEIIIKYIDYSPETVEAALYLMVEKGSISYDLKELLLNQIRSNFAVHNKRYKQNTWENNNAFIQYVSKYSDDEIYGFIEDPKDIVIDVYHAILVTAKERGLIPNDEFAEYYNAAKAVPKTRYEMRREAFNDIFEEPFIEKEVVTDTEVESEINKYWKCPACNQLVGMEFKVCLRCNTKIPETIVHPAKEEVIRQIKIRKSYNPVRSGLIIVAVGICVVSLAFSLGFSLDDFWSVYCADFIIGLLAILGGVVSVIYGLFFYSKNKHDTPK